MRHLFLLLLCALCLPMAGRAADWDGHTIATAYAGGSGTEADPYLIANCEQFAFFAQQVRDSAGYSRGKFFKLTADLVFNDDVYSRINYRDRLDKPDWPKVPEGYEDKYSEWVKVPDSIRFTVFNLMPFVGSYGKEIDGPEVFVPFEGCFDGDGHVLRGVFQDRMQNFGSVFPSVEGGEIRNLGIEDAYFVSNSQSGSFAGRLVDSKLINCYVRHSYMEAGGSYGGGLAGMLRGRTVVQNCFVSDCVVMGKNGVGGLVGRVGAGQTNGCLVENCYADALLKVKKGDGEYGSLTDGVSDTAIVRNCWYTMRGKGDVGIWPKNLGGTVTAVYAVSGEALQSDTLLARLYENAAAISGARAWVKGPNGQPAFASAATAIAPVAAAEAGRVVSVAVYSPEGEMVWRGTSVPRLSAHGLYIVRCAMADGRFVARKVLF